MTNLSDVILDHLNAVLLIFFLGATAASAIVKKPSLRIAGGLAVLAATVMWRVSTRTAYDWSVSAVERTSAPGLLLLGVLIYSAVSGKSLVRSAEFRFGTLMMIAGGLVLYPGAVGILNVDTYVPGYSGYLLPVALAFLLAILVLKGFVLSALSLNIGIAAFLASAGRSLNLWDYIIDPIACLLALVCWIPILATIALDRRATRKSVPV